MQRLCYLGIALLAACAAPTEDGSEIQTGSAALEAPDGGPPDIAAPGARGEKADESPPPAAHDRDDAAAREERKARSRERVRAELRAEADVVLADVVRVEHELVRLQRGRTTYELPYATAELRLVRRLRGAADVDEEFRIRFPQNLTSIGLEDGRRYVLALDGESDGDAWKVSRNRLGRHAARRVEGNAIVSNGLAVDDIAEEGGDQ